MVARKPRKPEDLRQTLDRALPRRALAVSRESLLDAMIERIERWKALQPEVEPRTERQIRSIAIARSLQGAAKRAGEKLIELGIEQEIEAATVQRSADTGLAPDNVKLGGWSAPLDLALLTQRLMYEIENWKEQYQHGKGAPRAFRVTLTDVLADLCCKRAGLSRNELDDLLSMISGEFGLPVLSTEALRKRKLRGTK